MTEFSQLLNRDGKGTRTSAEYDTGDSRWKLWTRRADGDDATQGAKADAAVSDPATAASVTARLAAMVSVLRTHALGILKLEDAAAGGGDAGVAVLAERRDTAATGVSATGHYERLSTDAFGRLRTVAKRDPDDELSTTVSTAEAAKLIVTTDPATLHSIVGYVAAGEDGWIQAFDADDDPGDTEVPVLSWPVGAASAAQPVNIPLPGHVFAAGLTLMWSTTGDELTEGGAYMFLTAYYSA